MFWVYVAATIFGGSFLVPMLLGGLASDVDADFGGDLDVEADIEFDAADAGGADFDSSGAVDTVDGVDSGDAGGDGVFDGALGAVFASIISFRTVVFVSAFFGAAGLVFGWLGYSSLVTFSSAVLVGVIAAVINATLFGLISQSQPNSQISDRTLEGRWAKVVLPMSPQQRGRIRIDLSGQPQYLVAKPIDDGSAQQFDVGTSVVVVKVEEGTALVSSVPELDSGEEA